MTKVLVVGGQGFLGQQIVSKLVTAGLAVKTLSRKPICNKDFEQFEGDFGNQESNAKILSTWVPEIVIQTAWITKQETYRNSGLNEVYANSTLQFAEQCFRAGTSHFLALGSSAEYGFTQVPSNAESSVAKPEDLYSEAKLRTSKGLITLGQRHSRKVSWVRVFQPYGPGQDSSRLLPSYVAAARQGASFHVSKPNDILDWVSSRDVASAVFYAIENNLPNIVDIGTGIGTTVIETLRKTAMVIGSDPSLIISSDEEMGENPMRLVVDSRSAIFEAGWRPCDSLIKGLEWTFEE
jgi:nucleoside-diphosphate-sugar epimerase